MKMLNYIVGFITFILLTNHCISTNSQEKNKPLEELKVIKGSSFELMKTYGGKFQINAFHGSQENIENLFSVRNRNASPIRKSIKRNRAVNNILYIELITSIDIMNDVEKHIFTKNHEIMNNYRLYTETFVLYNDGSIKSQEETIKPLLLSGKSYYLGTKKKIPLEMLYCYIFLIPLDEIDGLKMSFVNGNKIEVIKL